MAAPKPSSPHEDGQGYADSSNSIIVQATGPGDTTRRLRPRNVPRYYPGREPPEGYPGTKPPPDHQPPSVEGS